MYKIKVANLYVKVSKINETSDFETIFYVNEDEATTFSKVSEAASKAEELSIHGFTIE